MSMEMTPQLLKELQSLQELYKSNFDLVASKVEALAQQQEASVVRLDEANEELLALHELLKEIIAEKDVQVQRLMKVTAALTVVTEQISERFSQQNA
jgi:hypothetical protein